MFFRMADDGYRGYDINEEGSVIEYYDHRDEFIPPQVIERKPEKGKIGSKFIQAKQFLF
jgi:hypothetical protein